MPTKILKAIAILSLVLIPAYLAHATIFTDNGVPQIGGDVHLVHPSGSGTWYNATTSSDVGRGTVLLTAYDAAGNGDRLELASSTFDVGNHNLDLSKGGTISISMKGSGWYNTVIKSSWVFSTSPPYKDPIIACASNSEVSDLSVIGTASVGSFQAAWGAIGHGCSQTTLRRVFGQADTDIVYLNGITANSCFASTTIDSIITRSKWDSGVIATNCGSPNITIENSSINSFADPSVNSGSVARGFVVNSNGSTQTLHFINNIFNVGGGSSVNQGISNSVNSSTYVDSGMFNVTGANAIDMSNTTASGANIYVNSSVSYDVTKISGIIQASQAGSLSGYIVASTTNATSTLAGGVNVQNGGFVVQQTSGNVGVSTPNPVNPFQLGPIYLRPSAPATGLTGSQDLDNNGECYTDNSTTYHLTVYPYASTPFGTTIQGSVSNTFTWVETGSGLQYTENESWTASTDPSVTGYIIFNDQLGWWDVGNTTSVGDDGCGYGSTPYQNSPVGPAFKITSLGNTAQMGTATIGSSSPQSDPLTIYEQPANTGQGITIYSIAAGTGNNANGDIVIRDVNDSNNIKLRFYATSVRYGDFDLVGSGTSANSIFGEASGSNSSSACADKRQGGLQYVNDGDASHGGMVFYTRGYATTPSSTCNTVLNVIAEARGGTLGIGWNKSGYIFATSTLGVYGETAIGRDLYSTVKAPNNGLIVEGSIGAGTTSPWGVISAAASSTNNSNLPLIVASRSTGSATTTVFIVTSMGNTGVGTTSPSASSTVQSNSSTGDAFVIATSSNATIGGYDNDGHRFTGGPPPTISSCGTGTGTVVGDDQSGDITTATAATACTATFAKAYRASPVCTVTDNSLVGFADVSSVSTTAVTFGISSALTGGHLYYQCSYHR